MKILVSVSSGVLRPHGLPKPLSGIFVFYFLQYYFAISLICFLLYQKHVDVSEISSSFSLLLSFNSKVGLQCLSIAKKGLQELIYPELASLCLGGVCSYWAFQRCLSLLDSIIYNGVCPDQGIWVLWFLSVPQPSSCVKKKKIRSGQSLLPMSSSWTFLLAEACGT